MLVFEKTGIEGVTFEVDLTGEMPDGVTLAASGSSAEVFDVFDQDRTTTILASATVATTPGNNTARFACKAGSQPKGEYLVRMTLATSSGGPIEKDVLLYIRDRI